MTRPALFTKATTRNAKRTTTRLALRAHDLRASFVTIALSLGRSEAWVTDRTGHRSHEMVKRYQRAARQASELNLGDWGPLDVALGLKKGRAKSPTRDRARDR